MTIYRISSLCALLISYGVLCSWSVSQEMEAPRITQVKWGKMTVDGVEFEKDVVINHGVARKRKKGPSKPFREKYGHTPLTELEEVPWDCDTLVIGIGMQERLPVTDGFKKMAEEKGVTLILLQTEAAVKFFEKHYSDRVNAIFHTTC